MAFERVQLAPSIGTWNPIGIVAVISGILACGWFWSRQIYAGIVLTIIGLVIGYVVSAIRRTKANINAATTDLAKRGYKPDFQLGCLLIDSQAHVIAFVIPTQQAYDLYSTRDIVQWEHQWINKATATVNAWGNQVTGKINQANNILVFKTNNPHHPIYKISISDHQTGETWMAKLNAIFNTHTA